VVDVALQAEGQVVEQLVAQGRPADRAAEVLAGEGVAPPMRLLPRAEVSDTWPPAKPPREASKVLVVTCVRRIPSSGTDRPLCPRIMPSSTTWFSRSLMPATEKPIWPLTESSWVEITPAASCASVLGSKSGSGSRLSMSCVSTVDCSPALPLPGGVRRATTWMESSSMGWVESVMLASSSSSLPSRTRVRVTSALPRKETRNT
jgi:hypothetical protein